MKKSPGKYPKQLMRSLFLTALACLPFSIHAQKPASPLVTIDLEKVVNNIQEVPLSMVLDKTEYIPLKLTPESVLGARLQICLTNDYIIIYSGLPEEEAKISVFDRKTGTFIRNIGQRGNGPGEYLTPLETFYNRFNNRIYAEGKSGIIVYNLDGKFIETFNTPIVPAFPLTRGIDAFISADNFVNFTWNESEVMKDQIAYFNRKGEIKYYPPRKEWPAKYKTEYSGNYKYPVFYTWDNKLFVKAADNDTVFNITNEGIIPRIVLNSGSHKWQIHILKTLKTPGTNPRATLFYVTKIYESKNHFFFQYRFAYEKSLKLPYMHLGIYDKKTKKVFYCKNNTTDFAAEPSLEDDINGFMRITPVTVNENNEMVAILDAMDIVKWKEQNPVKAAAVQSRFPWLKDINEFDNPVILIGKCKE